MLFGPSTYLSFPSAGHYIIICGKKVKKHHTKEKVSEFFTEEYLYIKAGYPAKSSSYNKNSCDIRFFMDAMGNKKKQLMIKTEGILYIYDRLCKENLDYLT